MVKDVKAPGNIKLQRRRDTRRFRLRLLQKLVVEVAQDRHFLRVGVCKERAVHVPNSAVNDGLIDGLQALLAAYDKLAEGEDKVGFQRKGAVVLAVIEVNIHRVNVLRAVLRNLDNLSFQTSDKGVIFGFGVANDNVVGRDKKSVCDFAFCRKTFAAARCAEYQAVGIFQLLSVAQNHVVGKGV